MLLINPHLLDMNNMRSRSWNNVWLFFYLLNDGLLGLLADLILLINQLNIPLFQYRGKLYSWQHYHCTITTFAALHSRSWHNIKLSQTFSETLALKDAPSSDRNSQW